MSIKVLTLADEIYTELDNATNISVATVSFWLTSNLGKLNTLLDTEYVIADNEFSPLLGSDEASVYKQLYLVHHYDGLIRKSLGASAYDTNSVIEVKEGDRTIKKMNKTEVAKVYRQMKLDAVAELSTLTNAYRLNRADPLQNIVWDHPLNNEDPLYPSSLE